MAKLSRNIAIALLVVIGMLTASPSITAFHPSGITALYGVAFENDAALLLVRHRQIILGLLGATLVCGAFFVPLRMMAITINILSKSAFLGISLTTSNLTPGLQRIVYFDLVSVVLLLISTFIFLQPIFRNRHRLT
jgi:flagellar biosynthesis protein FlhB